VVRPNFLALDGAWWLVDGLKVPIQKLRDESIQNAFYNGWLRDHSVGCGFFLLKTCLIAMLSFIRS
jgi:hypothetical protein